jgi:hypothetical protein
MPSPFPGMDPFLEDPELFPDLHDRMVIHLSEAIQSRLPEPYYALTRRRVWLEMPQRAIWPDVNVQRQNGGAPAGQQGGGGTAVATAPRSIPVVVPVIQDEIRQPYVDILLSENGAARLVASIEVLSPSNKTPGDHGREPYLQKQRELLDSNAHLVEIDLLRGGTHTTAVPLALALPRTGPFDYHVCVHQFDRPAEFLVYPIRLEAVLPEIAIPLLPGVPPVLVDLQTVFDRAYDLGPYRRIVRYADGTPVPPLRPEQADWAAHLLREKGLLPPPATT